MSETPSIPPVVSPAPVPGRLPAPKRRRWPTALLAVVVFVAGMGVGAGGATIVIVRRALFALQHPEQAPTRLARELKRRLGLNESQRQAVERILAQRQQRLQAVRAEIQPAVEKELEEARLEISQVLLPEQRAKWDATYEDLKGRWMPR